MKYSHYKIFMFGLAMLCILTIVVTAAVFILVAFQIIDTAMVYIPVGLVLIMNIAGILSGYIKVEDKMVTTQFIDNKSISFMNSSHEKEDALLTSQTKFGSFGKWIVKIAGRVFLESKAGTRFETLSKKVYMFVNRHVIKPLPLDAVKQLAQQA